MNTITRRTAVLAVAVLGLAACSDSDSGPGTDTRTASLAMYYTDAAGPLDQLNIKFTIFAIYNTAGQKVALTMPADMAAVDLIASKDNPQYLRTFQIPVGDYNAIEGSFEIVNFRVAGDTAFCVVSNPVHTIPKISVEGAAVRVTDAGVQVVVDIPVISGNCPADNAVGTIQFGAMSVYPRQ